MVGESAMLAFTPAPPLRPQGGGSAWRLDKIGSAIDPEDVVLGGNQYNHGVWGGATAATAAGAFHLESLDACNMNPVTPTYPYGNPLPASYNYTDAHRPKRGMGQLPAGSVKGMAVNLHNNLWNTNYPLWYPYYDSLYCDGPLNCTNANARFRFRATFG